MKGLLVVFAIALGLLVLALGAWAVQGVRWVVTGSSRRRRGLAAA